MKKILLIVILFCSHLSTQAHSGKHQNNEVNSKIWHFQDKTIATEGYFLFTKNNQVFIENKAGLVQSFEINKLSWMDKNYVNRRITEIGNLNKEIQYSTQKSNSAYIFICILGLGLILFFLKKSNPLPYLRYSFVAFACVFYACKKEVVDTATTTTTTTTATTTNPTTIDASYSVFKSTVSTRSDNAYYYIESNGLPTHNMMLGITNWQQQVPIPQNYTGTNAWSIPLKPEFATSPLSTKTNFMKGAIAIAANGIPIFNPLNNRGEDSYLIGELDQWGGHCGKADDYHYHIPPLHLESQMNNKPIAWSLDGYAVYGSKEADGTAMQTLDSYHGHSIGTGVYHYHGNLTYPYMIGSMRGKVSLDPNTAAPENQILPQALTTPIRPAGDPLKGATITNFKSTGTNAYFLEYTVGNQKGYINYSWDAANKYTYTFIGTDGKSTTASYIKK
jgi:hypothetical protein